MNEWETEITPVNWEMHGLLCRITRGPGGNHVPIKPAFTVQATYKFIGKLKPRQFPLDELIEAD